MIKIICVGKLKEKYIKDGIDEYLKRLSKYTKIKVIEVEDKEYNDTDKTLNTELKSILKHIEVKDYVVTLNIEGNELNSVELSNLIENANIYKSNITFIIGGSYGLSDEINNRTDYKLSFGKLTFPHQLFRLILLEQIYRSYKIINNETYHK